MLVNPFFIRRKNIYRDCDEAKFIECHAGSSWTDLQIYILTLSLVAMLRRRQAVDFYVCDIKLHDAVLKKGYKSLFFFHDKGED